MKLRNCSTLRSLLLLPLALGLLLGALGCGPTGDPNEAAIESPMAPSDTPSETSSAGYDPNADPVQDLAVAIVAAESEGKRILLEVGGEWCKWCHILEAFVHDTPAVESALEAGFVVVKVNYSDENENAAFLGDYPEIPGYPHLFVLEADGTFLHSQDTAELEAEGSYDESAFLEFLQAWSPSAA